MLSVQAYGGHLQELFDLCEQIVGMHTSIVSFLRCLRRGDFIQCSLETLLLVSLLEKLALKV